MNNITSKDLFNIFVRNILVILVSAVVFAVGAFVYCENFTEEKYKAQGEILVTNGGIVSEEGTNQPVQNTDLAASVNLLPTIRSALKGVGIYKEFAVYLSENSNYNFDYKQLKSAASVEENDEKTLFITICFELGTADEAIEITNHFLAFAPTYIEAKLEGCRVSADAECDSAVKTAPRTLSTAFIAAVAGAFLCYLVVFLITILNSTIKSDDDFSSRYNIPVIGNIPDFSISHNNSTSKKSHGGKKNG